MTLPQITSTTSTITIPDHVHAMPNGELVSYRGGTIRNLKSGTRYWVYCDDPAMLGGNVTYKAATNLDDANRAGRMFKTFVWTLSL